MNAHVPSPTDELLSLTLNFCEDCLSRHDFTAAWKALCRALALAPNRADLLCHRGRLALFLNDTEAAERDFAEALKHEPRCSAALSGLARYYMQQDELTEAAAAADRALDIDSLDEEAAKLKAEIHAERLKARRSKLNSMNSRASSAEGEGCVSNAGDGPTPGCADRQVPTETNVSNCAVHLQSPKVSIARTDPLMPSSLRLDFGCGEAGPQAGFVGVDIRLFPGVQYTCNAWDIVDHVEPNSVEAICSRHFFEHLTFKQAEKTLKAWLTILKPGGVLEAIVPDIRYHIAQFLTADPNQPSEANSKWTVRQHALAGFWGWQREADTSPWDVHKSGYDYPLLLDALQSAGFHEIQRLKDKSFNLAVRCRKPEANCASRQVIFQDLMTHERQDCKASLDVITPKKSFGTVDCGTWSANDMPLAQPETVKSPIQFSELPHPHRDAAYYQRLHEQESSYQNNNWLLDELHPIGSFGANTVLELACGNGRFLERAASLFECVTGCDWAVSPRIKAVLAAHSNVKFFQVDLYQQLPSCRAELVVSADFLEHIDPHSLLRVLQRIDSLADMAFHKIACYDDMHSHLSILSPAGWLTLFCSVNSAYKLEKVELRGGDPARQIAVFSKGRPCCALPPRR